MEVTSIRDETDYPCRDLCLDPCLPYPSPDPRPDPCLEITELYVDQRVGRRGSGLGSRQRQGKTKIETRNGTRIEKPKTWGNAPSCSRGGFALVVCFAVFSILLTSTAFAHRPIDTTIAGSLFLTDTELRHEIKVGHFLLPPSQKLSMAIGSIDSNQLNSDIQEYIATKHPVTIDRIRVPPTIRDLDLAAVTNAPYLNARTNYIRVAFTAAYAIKMPPRQISLVWQLYPGEPEGGWKGIVDADQDPYQVIQTFDVRGVGDFVYFHPDEPEFVWHDLRTPGRAAAPNTQASRSAVPIPILSLCVCLVAVFTLTQMTRRKRSLPVRIVIAAEFLVLAFLVSSIVRVNLPNPLQRVSMPSDTQALGIFESLHANVYRAFDYTREEDIYDVLAQSVDGALLNDLYAQIYKSLVLRFSGGAVCKVARVEILEATLEEKTWGGRGREHVLTVNCHWRVQGIVEHWEHLHRRINEYQARFTLSPRGGEWKICDIDITRQERVGTEDTKPAY